MKRLLLLMMVVPVLLFGQQSQFKSESKEYKKPILYKFDDANINSTSQAFPRKIQTRDLASGIVPMSSSGNAYTLILPYSTCLSADVNTNTVIYTHRGHPGVIGTSVGDIISTFTTDFAQTMESLVVVEQSTGKENRYPSGVLYNPTGNTDPMNQYVVVVGPSHDGNPAGSTWDRNYFGSMKLDGTNQSVLYKDNPITGGTIYEMLIRTELTSSDDGSFHIVSPFGFYDIDPITQDSVTRRSLWMETGEFNTANSEVDWTSSRYYHNFKVLSSRPTLDYQTVYDYKMAWSQDGQIGYLIYIATDSLLDSKSPHPIIYKTDDAGATWELFNLTDFTDVPQITDYLRKTNQGTKRPYFYAENDAVVDYKGDLHLFAMLVSASSDHVDSTGWIWTRPQYLFHIWPKSTGWDAEIVDTITSFDLEAADSWFSGGGDALGWDHRIQASRTQDGKQVFVFLTDTESNLNEFPDLKGWGKDLTDNSYFEYTDFTVDNNSISGEALLPYVSNITFRVPNGSGVGYWTPVIVNELENGPIDPVYHNLLMFTGWDLPSSIEENNNINVSGVYPNPVTDMAQVQLNLNKTSDIKIEVINLIGQVVNTVNYKSLPQGENVINLDLTDLNAGVYILKLNDGNSSQSYKVIVE